MLVAEMHSQLVLGTVIIATLIALALYYFSVWRRKRSTTISLIGPSDSGKTLLFYTLLRHANGRDLIKPSLITFTSMQENSAVWPLSRDLTMLVDSPGYPSFREQTLELARSSRKIIYVTDATKSSDKLLYDILEDSYVSANCYGILIVANKQDVHPMTANKLKHKLEEQFSKLRRMQSSMQDISGLETENANSSNNENNFLFKQLRVPVYFGELATSQGRIKDVLDFI